MKALALLLGLALPAPTAAGAAGERILEVHHQEFYDGLAVTSNRFADGRLVAYVSEKGAGGTLKTSAELTLDMETLSGTWKVWGDGIAPLVEETFDYRNRTEAPNLESILRAHTVKSVALSALLLWEDHVAACNGEAACGPLGRACPGCTLRPNGCTGSWLLPGECGTGNVSIVTACRAHDDCYQCGMFCAGTTRAQCDARFRQDIEALTNDPDCAWTYYWGVRLFGWLFYRNPLGRIPEPDVYRLGLFVTACPPGLYHLCTIYVF